MAATLSSRDADTGFAAQTTTLARQPANVDDLAMYNATGEAESWTTRTTANARTIALAVRDSLLKRWNDTTAWHTMRAPKRVRASRMHGSAADSIPPAGVLLQSRVSRTLSPSL